MHVNLHVSYSVVLDCDLREFFDMISDGNFTHKDRIYAIKNMELGTNPNYGVECDLRVIETEK